MPIGAWIGLGGNVGDPVATLRAALTDLDALPDTRLMRASRLYRTPAWGMANQPDFVNAVALLETALGARDLLDGLLGIERAFGRERRERWGPRVLDLDLLLYGDAVIDEPGLRVPHPHLHQRAFALLPLVEIDPGVSIPGRGPARDALAALAYDGIEVVG
ncbi:MAG: 2-amino-4-hydroxy-6-hydroxymethyldihydropteridine diphosphokinase [Luteimonas sp.]